MSQLFNDFLNGRFTFLPIVFRELHDSPRVMEKRENWPCRSAYKDVRHCVRSDAADLLLPFSAKRRVLPLQAVASREPSAVQTPPDQ